VSDRTYNRTVSVISQGTIEYTGTSYTVDQCAPGATNFAGDNNEGASAIEITNSLLTDDYQHLIFSNPAGVTISGDVTDNITVKGDYSQAATLSGKSLTLSGTALQTIDGNDSEVGDLIIDNATGVALSSPLTVNGTLTLTSGNVSLGDNDLTIASTGTIAVDAENSPYIITDGAGALTQSLEAAEDKLYPVGISAASYDPALINATTDATFSVKVGAELTGTANSGQAFNPRQWDITPASSTTATITLTPSTTAYSTTPIISQYNGSAWTDEVLSSTPYTGTYTISEATSFATGGSDGGTTSIESPTNQQTVTVRGQTLSIDGLQAGDVVNIYTAAGSQIANAKAASAQLSIPVDGKGIYLVSIKSSDTENVLKVAVK
jgi:hypothetical protein